MSDLLTLKDEEEIRHDFRPLGMDFMRAESWGDLKGDSRWVWPWIKPHVRRYLLLGVFFAIATSASVAVPRIVATIVDEVLVKPQNPFAPWGWALGGVIILKVICDLVYKWGITRLGQGMARQIRADVFTRLGQLPLAFFDANSSGRLISRCVNDISNLSALFTPSFFTMLSDSVVIIGCLVVMSTLSPLCALAVLITILPMTVYMLNVSQSQMHTSREMRNVLSRMSSHTGDTMNNLGVLHSQPFAAKWEKRHGRLQTLYAGHTVRAIFIWGSFSSIHVFVMGLCYAMVILAGVHDLRNGTLSIGGFIACCTYVTLIFEPFMEISDKLNSLLTAIGSVKRLRTLLPAPPAKDIIDSREGSRPQGDITISHLDFAYRPDRPLFKDFSLTLPEGKVTALVGRTGSGKTTLGHLLLGLYAIQDGKLQWGKTDLTTLTAAQRGRWIASVSQDLFLFSDTLRENLRLWRQDVSDEQILERLRRVGLAEKILALPEGLSTQVKSETLPFSQGEKQLLLLCRALLQDPYLLVFDEATASLDQLSEDMWLSHVAELFNNRTTLFIAHRLETLRLAHHVVVLENGRVIKQFNKVAGVPVDESQLQADILK